jgi:signal transduction histidine kinase
MSGARHLLSLINEVLGIAAIEAGRLSLSLEPVALADVAAEAVSLIRPLADQHHGLSADARPALIERLLGEGVRGFLTKALDVKELLALVDGIAAEREQAAAR